ncbi:WD repeat, SAM and U-box domain-containing protein 1-like [Pollicipes pollicipes]|uniref:WD repeat, SAM and U-box domain-containing protein 1-like n=1 Tax=Pollicipes pollicipes TaxID=41117 RepID=UPI001884C609|nr:WD repeat, SAM and U-box domain-containing protein 1-like [Pollicipes pollicipes]
MGASKPDLVLSGHTNDVNSCDYSADGLLVTSASDKTVRVWLRQPATDEFVEVAYSPLTYHTYSVHCVRFAPRGGSFISCSTDGTAVVWNAKTGVTMSTLRHPSQSPLRACCFSPDGSLIATAGDDGDVCVWSAEQPTILLTLRGHEETVSCLSFNGDGALLASGALIGELRLWQPRSGQTGPVGGVPTAHDLGVTSCDFMPRSAAHDGAADILASCGTDCAVRLWTVLPSGGVAPLTSLLAHTGAVMSVRFSADGALLASAAGDKTVRLWNTSSWSLVSALHGHQRYVTCCCFSPDGRLLVSGSNDKTVRLRLLG